MVLRGVVGSVMLSVRRKLDRSLVTDYEYVFEVSGFEDQR